MRVRRWDQKGLVFRKPTRRHAGAGAKSRCGGLDRGNHAVPTAATTLLLENGVTVSFASTGANGFPRRRLLGISARTADARRNSRPRAAARHPSHYARLGIWDVAAGPWPTAVIRGRL